MSYQDVLALPVRAFWFLNKQIIRVRSEEILDWLPAHASAMGGENVNRLAQELKGRVGNPTVTEQRGVDAGAANRLKDLFGGM